MACDICGKTGIHLDSLRQPYQLPTIKDICSNCSKKVNDEIWRLRELSRQREELYIKALMCGLRKKEQTK